MLCTAFMTSVRGYGVDTVSDISRWRFEKQFSDYNANLSI